MSIDYDQYYIYFAYKNKKIQTNTLEVPRSPLIVLKDDLNDDNIICQYISDKFFNQILNKTDHYEFYIFLVKINIPIKPSELLLIRQSISNYFYNESNYIYLLKKFTYNSELNMNLLSTEYESNMNLYENNMSYQNLQNIFIRYLPEELILIIYEYLDISILSLNVYNLEKNNIYICNPCIEIKEKHISNGFDRKISLISSYSKYKFII